MEYAKDRENESPYISVNTLIQPKKGAGSRAFPPYATEEQKTQILATGAPLSALPPKNTFSNLTISRPNDPAELEADRVAAEVTNNTNVDLQAKQKEQPRIYAKSSGGKEMVSDLPNDIHNLSGGQPLGEVERNFFEPRFGSDFSGVRVHTDERAAGMAEAVNAQAFTKGNDIVFAKEKYQPGTESGKRLIAHELTHVEQQRSVSGLQYQLKTPVVRDHYEREADDAADKAKNGIVSQSDSAHRISTPVSAKSATGSIQREAKKGDANSNQGLTSGILQGTSTVIDVITTILKNPPASWLLGLFCKDPQGLVNDLDKKLKSVLRLIQYAIDNPEKVLEAFQGAFAQLINQVEDKAKSYLTGLGKHFSGVWRHLKIRLDYLKENWWPILKEVGWSIIWPIPNTVKDIQTIFGHLQSAWNNFLGAKFSEGIEEVIMAWREGNALVGRYYGWIFLASIIIGGIIGGVAGGIFGVGAGAIPGAIGGMKIGADVAINIGYYLLLSAISAEAAMIGKSIYDIAKANTDAELEVEYGQIADSAIALGIMGVFIALGAIAASFARAVVTRIAGFIRKFFPKKALPETPIKIPPETPTKVPPETPTKAPIEKPSEALPETKPKPDVDPAKSQSEEPIPSKEQPEIKPEAPKTEPFKICFIAGTQVQLPDRTEAIENLIVGDFVISKEPGSSSVVRSYPVLATFMGQTQTLTHIGLDDGMLHSTCNHPFYVIDKGWIPAGEIKPGDLLEGPNCELVAVRSVEIEKLQSQVATYNLSVDQVCAYFVLAGNQAVLVHNNNTAFYDQVLYWFFGNNPAKVRVDVDGASIWRTNSAEEVRVMMETRVNEMGRSTKDPSICWTQEEFEAILKEKGLTAPQTEGRGQLAGKLGADHHYSLRTVDAPTVVDPANPPDMNPEQINTVKEKFGETKPPRSTTPKKIQLDFEGCG